MGWAYNKEPTDGSDDDEAPEEEDPKDDDWPDDWPPPPDGKDDEIPMPPGWPRLPGTDFTFDFDVTAPADRRIFVDVDNSAGSTPAAQAWPQLTLGVSNFVGGTGFVVWFTAYIGTTADSDKQLRMAATSGSRSGEFLYQTLRRVATLDGGGAGIDAANFDLELDMTKVSAADLVESGTYTTTDPAYVIPILVRARVRGYQDSNGNDYEEYASWSMFFPMFRFAELETAATAIEGFTRYIELKAQVTWPTTNWPPGHSSGNGWLDTDYLNDTASTSPPTATIDIVKSSDSSGLGISDDDDDTYETIITGVTMTDSFDSQYTSDTGVSGFQEDFFLDPTEYPGTDSDDFPLPVTTTVAADLSTRISNWSSPTTAWKGYDENGASFTQAEFLSVDREWVVANEIIVIIPVLSTWMPVVGSGMAASAFYNAGQVSVAGVQGANDLKATALASWTSDLAAFNALKTSSGLTAQVILLHLGGGTFGPRCHETDPDASDATPAADATPHYSGSYDYTSFGGSSGTFSGTYDHKMAPDTGTLYPSGESLPSGVSVQTVALPDGAGDLTLAAMKSAINAGLTALGANGKNAIFIVGSILKDAEGTSKTFNGYVETSIGSFAPDYGCHSGFAAYITLDAGSAGYTPQLGVDVVAPLPGLACWAVKGTGTGATSGYESPFNRNDTGSGTAITLYQDFGFTTLLDWLKADTGSGGLGAARVGYENPTWDSTSERYPTLYIRWLQKAKQTFDPNPGMGWYGE